MKKLQRFKNFTRLNESATIEDAKQAIKDVFKKHDGEVTKTFLTKLWQEETVLRDLYGIDLFYKAWDRLIDEEEIKTEDGVKYCWCDMVQESFKNKLNESRKLTEKEIEELGDQDVEEIESDNDFLTRYRLEDGRIIDVSPTGDYFLVDESEDEPTKKRKLSKKEVDMIEDQGLEEIESDNDFLTRYRLEDGRIIDVSPTGEYFLVGESFRNKNRKNKLNEKRKLSEREINRLGNQDFEEIESDNDLMRRYRLKDGKIIDVNPMGEYFLVDGSEDEPTKKRKLSEREINRLGNQDFEEIESDNDLMRRYRLKDGKIIDVSPTGEYFLVIESVSKEDEEKYLTPKQRKLPEGLKKAIIKKAKKSKKKNESVESSLNENISKEDEEKYLTPKQRKLPEGLKKAIINRAKKSKGKKSEKKK